MLDDWQACLAPDCQKALVLARDDVARRGGAMITAEDFLLALLDAIPAVPAFLCRQGVDLDELVRTIQGEQPIVAEVVGDGNLSSQLMYWIACSRDAAVAEWLGWPQLLHGLTSCAERMQDKAYVAVLELVGRWPVQASGEAAAFSGPAGELPVAVADAGWWQLAEDVAVTLASNERALLWVTGERGSGKTAWLHSLRQMPGLLWVQIDPRRQADIMASDQAVVPRGCGAGAPWPTLVMDNVCPAELLALMAEPGNLIRELITGWGGPLLLLAPAKAGTEVEGERLGFITGRDLEVLAMPTASVIQRKAVLTVHQPAVEKRWNVRLSLAAIEYAASHRSCRVATPGAMLAWVRRAAARLDFFASCGSLEVQAISGQHEVMRRQSLVALARNESCNLAEREMSRLQVEQAAAEVSWHERQCAGTLRLLQVDDLCLELERWVAAGPGPVQYVRRC